MSEEEFIACLATTPLSLEMQSKIHARHTGSYFLEQARAVGVVLTIEQAEETASIERYKTAQELWQQGAGAASWSGIIRFLS